MRHTLFFATIVAVALDGSPATACEQALDLDNGQVRELAAIVSDENAGELDRIFAFKDLACAKRSEIRDFSYRLGLRSPSSTVRTEVLKDSLMRAKILVVKFLLNDGMSSEQVKYSKEKRQFSLDSAAPKPEDGYIEYTNQGQLYVSGDAVNLVVRKSTARGNGTLSLKDGELVGQFKPADAAFTVPVKIEFFR